MVIQSKKLLSLLLYSLCCGLLQNLKLVRSAAFFPSSSSSLSVSSTINPIPKTTTVLYAQEPQQKRPARKRRPKQPKDVQQEINIDNLLSNMGLQKVTSVRCQNNNHTLPNTETKKRDKVAAGNENVPSIDLQTQLNYSRNGHTVLRNFISPSMANLYDIRESLLDLAVEKELKAWKQKVQVASNNDHELIKRCKTIEECQAALTSLGVTASLPFLQFMNTWREVSAVRDLAFALGESASILLNVPTVRLYQDSVFWKRTQDGPTPWHVDARMAPFDTSHMVTFWIPLTEVPKGGTALIFCSKSHSDFALPYWNPLPSSDEDPEQSISSEWDRLEARYPKKLVDYMPLNVGDVTVHSGWTLHCSHGNEGQPGAQDRIALAISFVDAEAEIRSDWQVVGDNEDLWSYEEWCREVPTRTKFSHKLVPIVWPCSMD